MENKLTYKTKSAVLMLTFNRLETTKQVFSVIREVKPPKLYLASDGARESVPQEHEKVNKVRNFLLNNVDWECEIKTLFQDKNLGCGVAVSTALDWFFENEEMGIILEDDCLPSISFFRFCDELLEKYREDERIMHISGDNFQDGIIRNNASYYFSKISHVWGWATWRRAWKLYDFKMRTLDNFIEKKVGYNIWSRKQILNYWIKQFKKVANNKIDTWDYQWNYCLVVNNGLSILPNVNLVENIGFHPEATHTKERRFINKKNEITFPLKHPVFFVPDMKADAYTYRKYYKLPLLIRLLNKLMKYFQ
ncbi:MAG: nucleotide-diphospho-sugar transferase [Ignavibacterium sp.]|uniref:nucleotide-diphospho-sugar transferase n=1 Tax=Ignavibacterium sp. TaxID=2651167 RepID=UPI00404B5B83